MGGCTANAMKRSAMTMGMARSNGYAFALASAAVAGSIATLGKIALGQVDPITIAAVIDLLAAAMIFPAAPRLTIRRGDWPMVLAISLLGGLASPALFYVGLVLTTATSAALLVNSEVLFTILIAMGLLGERGNRQEYLAVGLLALGAVVVTTNLQGSLRELLATLAGNSLLLLSYLGWGFDNNISRILSERNNTFQLVWVKYTIGGGLLLPIALLLGGGLPRGAGAYGPLLALALCYVVATWTFYAALQRIGAMRSIALFSTTALFGVLVATAVLSEAITSTQALAGLVMGAGVVLIAFNEQRRTPRAKAGPALGQALPVDRRRG